MSKDKKFSLEDVENVILFDTEGESIMEFTPIPSNTEGGTGHPVVWEIADIGVYSIVLKSTSTGAYLDIHTNVPVDTKIKIGDRVNIRLGDED